MPSDAVVKSVSKKLKYYFQVKRLEDGFDLSGPDCPRLDHPPLKSRPTLQYDGLHDRPLKHYFSPAEVRALLTQFNVPEETSGNEDKVKKKMKKYINKYDFKDTPTLTKDKPSALSDGYYAKQKDGGRHTRHQMMGFGVPLQATHTRPRTSYPILRSTPSALMTRGEANRIVNMASRLVVATNTIDLKNDGERRHEKSSYNHSKKSKENLPVLQSGSRPAESPHQATYSRASPRSCPRSFESRRRVVEYDQNGRKVSSAKRRRSSEERSSASGSTQDMCVTISGQQADDRKVPPWLKKEMRKKKVDGQSQAQRPHSGPTPKSSAARPPSGSRPRSAAVPARGGSGKKAQPKPHRPADPGTLPAQVQPAAWDLEVCSSCADEEQSQNPAPPPRDRQAQTSPELLKHYDPSEAVIWDGESCRYRVRVLTGDKQGAGTRAEIHLVLCGDKGRTEDIALRHSTTYKIPFQKGQEDVFELEPFYVGRLRKVIIGHDRTELGMDWYLSRVIVEDRTRLVCYTVPCDTWLSSKAGDGQTTKEFSVTQSNTFKDKRPRMEEREEPELKRKDTPPIAYSRQAPSEDSASHTSLDMNRSRKDPSTTDGSIGHPARPSSARSGISSTTASTSSYHTDTLTGSTSSTSSSSSASPRPVSPPPRESAHPAPPRRVHLPSQRRHDDFFDQHVSEKDYTSVIDSLADRERDFAPPETTTTGSSSDHTVTSGSNQRDASRPQSGTARITLAPVSNNSETTKTQHNVTFTQDQHKLPKRNESEDGYDSETARLSAGDQSEVSEQQPPQSENQHQFMDGFKAGLEAAKQASSTGDSQRRYSSSSDSSASVLVGPSVHEAARSGDVQRLKRLAKHNADQLKLCDERGWTPLHVGAKHGQVEVLQWLAVNVHDLDVLTTTSYTACHIAAMSGHTACIKVLSAMGANIDCKNLDQQTALHLAAMGGFLETVQWLVMNDADIRARDSTGQTPLERARMCEQTAVVKYLESCERELADPASPLATSMTRGSPRTLTASSSSTGSSNTSGSTSGSSQPTHVHAHAYSATADSGRPKTSRGERAGREDAGGRPGQSAEFGHDQQLMTGDSGRSFLDSIRDEYAQS